MDKARELDLVPVEKYARVSLAFLSGCVRLAVGELVRQHRETRMVLVQTLMLKCDLFTNDPVQATSPYTI
jgi:hypothetical protein